MDLLIFAYVAITFIRLIGFFVLVDIYRTVHEKIYLWLSFGWFIYALSTFFGMTRAIRPEPVLNFFYLSFALLGVYFLTSGAIWLFRPFNLRVFGFGAGLIFLTFTLVFILSGEKFVGLLVPLVQFIILTTVTTIAIIKHEDYRKAAGNSINWLLAIFLLGIPQALAYVFLQPAQVPPVSLLLTSITSTLIAIYFVQLQHNLSRVKLSESESRYRLLVENQSDLIVKISPTGEFLYVNPKSCELFGKNQADLQSINFFSLLHPDDRVRLLATMDDLKNPPHACRVEVRTCTVEGWRWISWAERPVFDKLNQITAITASGRDIEDRKDAEKRILELNSELEQRVTKRTSELESLNKELKNFTYSISHDLRAPLRHIDGYSQILLEDYSKQLDEAGILYLNRIQFGVDKMRNLLDDLLAYSRLDTLPWQAKHLSIQSMLDEIINDYSIEFTEKKTKFVFNLLQDVVFIDEEGLRQILANLIDNAIKYSKNALTPIVEIGSKKQPSIIQIWIRDNGIGFDMQDHDKLFEMFQRLHPESEFSGTGMGLAIVAKAAQRVQGKVWAESEPGRGATFFLEIPSDIKENILEED